MSVDVIKCSKCGELLETVVGEPAVALEATALVGPCATCIHAAYVKGVNEDTYEEDDEEDDWDEEDDDWDFHDSWSEEDDDDDEEEEL